MIGWIDSLFTRMLWVAQIIILCGLLIVCWYAMDRKEPFAVLSVEPSSARPGEVIQITARVWRDNGRDCSAQFARRIVDASGTGFDVGHGIASASMINSMETQNPGVFRIKMVVPVGAADGPAVLQTSLRYACNKVHYLWPIEVLAQMPFTVLP